MFTVLPAHAGVFSFLWPGSQSKEANIIISYQTSQDVPLLRAPRSVDPMLAIGGGGITTVDDSSLLPVVGPLGSLADIDTYKLDHITTYTVHAGDTLSGIANMFGVSVNTIRWSNNLKRGDSIHEGNVLVILPVSGIQYTVKKGDTAVSLAKRYGSDADEILAFNGFSDEDGLSVGEVIIIPDAEIQTSTPNYSSSSDVSKKSTRGSGVPEYIGYYMRPIVGGHKSQRLHGFNGVDLANSCGTPVYASAGGDVIIARSSGWNGGYGSYIVVDHPNGTQTLYSHLSKVLVSAGWHVSQGYQIGSIGSTGKSSGCHVHFEVRGAKNPF